MMNTYQRDTGFMFAVVVVIVVFLVVAATITILLPLPAVTTQFGDMVNASVLLFDDNGHASGVFIADNVILTAAHCLRDKEFINIELSDGTIVGSDDFYIDTEEDVGFIFVDVNEPHIANISKELGKVGDTVYLVGAPYHKDYKFSLFQGIISHLNRNISEYNWSALLQTDADSGMGNSGGPLYNSGGDLIGMYVGQFYRGGLSISLCEDINSIMEAYQRYEDAQ